MSNVKSTAVSTSALTRRAFLRRCGTSLAALAAATYGQSFTTAAPTRGTASTPPNIIFITVDALRADHLSSYGYQRTTTPNLDTLLANQGIRFQRATSTAPWTFPANAAIMTGRIPTSLGVSWETAALPKEVRTLADYLHDGGYYTAGFVNNYYVSRKPGFARGFDYFDDSLANRTLANKAWANEVNNGVIGWLQNTWTREINGTKPLFLFIYYFDPHVWYNVPPPYDTRYDSSYTGTLTAEAYGTGEPVVSGQIVPTERDIEHLIALYDGSIAFWDAHILQLWEQLQSSGILDDALVVMTADHGEMFGEHNKWTHANGLYEEVLRVPLLMRYPGAIQPGTMVDVPVQTMDILPTILDLAGFPIPADVHGISLRTLIQGETPSGTRDLFSVVDGLTRVDHPIYWLAPRGDLRALERGEWKLIYHADDTTSELYQLQSASLYEVADLVNAEPDRAKELRDEVWRRYYPNLFYPYNTYLPALQQT